MVQVRPRQGGQATLVSWLADSGVRRSLISETDWIKMKQNNFMLKLKKNKAVFTPYGTNYKLPVMGRSKVVMENKKGLQFKLMSYVVQGKTESLLGKNDGCALAPQHKI